MTKRTEYPRPQFVRDEWMNLNGAWDFLFGDEEEWRNIEVPFAFQSPLSGIGINKMCDDMVYRRRITIPYAWQGKRIRLHFGAVDYRCRVYVNNRYVGKHTGGNIGFSLDITDQLTWQEEEITVEINDPCTDETIPRGKQFWRENQEGIWYTRTSGIWQSVWLEPLDEFYLCDVKYTGDIDDGSVFLEYECSKYSENSNLHVQISMEGEPVADVEIKNVKKEGSVSLSLFGKNIFHTGSHGGGWCWSPENPKLFDVSLKLSTEDKSKDEVKGYFGLRKIEARNGQVYLNNRPYIQKLVLDQGYWRDGLLTAPSDEALKADIELSKSMGFNGCRKHQKSEDPRFLFWADQLGYLVWEEVGACAQFSRKSVKRTIMEWSEAVHRDYNHPCIAAWVVLNESWGVPEISLDKRQQAHSMALYYQVKSLDHTRLVVNNDGWEMTKSDICAIHNYKHGNKDEFQEQEYFRQSLSSRFKLISSMPAGRSLYADGYSYQGEPIMLTEFGGVSFQTEVEKGWGYTSADSSEELLQTYARMIQAIGESTALSGYCYTQLTDVEQEINGLLTYDREKKVDAPRIKALNDSITPLSMAVEEDYF